MVTLDCVIVMSAKRAIQLGEQVLTSVLRQRCFGEVFVVGDYWPGEGYRYLPVPPLTGTTVDALVKRDCATVASRADAILYLCDDHALLGEWALEWPAYAQANWGVLVPARYTDLDGTLVEINNGMDPRDPNGPHCGGHAGIYRREVLRRYPWSSAPHHPNWDLLHSRHVAAGGWTLATAPDLRVCDIDPNPAEKPRHFTL